HFRLGNGSTRRLSLQSLSKRLEHAHPAVGEIVIGDAPVGALAPTVLLEGNMRPSRRDFLKAQDDMGAPGPHSVIRPVRPGEGKHLAFLPAENSAAVAAAHAFRIF